MPRISGERAPELVGRLEETTRKPRHVPRTSFPTNSRGATPDYAR